MREEVCVASFETDEEEVSNLVASQILPNNICSDVEDDFKEY